MLVFPELEPMGRDLSRSQIAGGGALQQTSGIFGMPMQLQAFPTQPLQIARGDILATARMLP